VAGLVLLKMFDSRRVLVAFGALGAVTLAVALAGSRLAAMIAFPLFGFWAWPLVANATIGSQKKKAWAA
jgi:hypothetical protein